MEDFNPQPLDCKAQATSNLATFMQKVKGRNLGVSLLLDPSAQVWTEETTETPAVVSTEQLHKSVAAFKDSLKLPTAELKRIERETRDQSRSPLWFSVCRYRSQLHILERSSSAFQLLLHTIWYCTLFIPSHLTVLQLNGERHMKPVLLRNIESTTTAEITLTW